MSRYRIFKAYYEWHVYEYGHERYGSFPTWAESMEYAHRQAQPTPNAITIEDPSGKVCDLTATITNRRRVKLEAGGDTFTLIPHEWKPLAEFLLEEAKNCEEE